MDRITSHPEGGIRELFALSAPLFFSLVSNALMLFCDRLYLSHYSLEAFQAIGVAAYLLLLFQATTIRVCSINQIFIGRFLGMGEDKKVGPYTWQMIWCALLSMILTLPIGQIVSKLYFSGTEAQELGQAYFTLMMLGNFLFPLGSVLAAFEMGIGKMRVLTLASFSANLFNIALDYVLIYGIPSLLPPLGIKGAAIATLISQGLYCGILFTLFIHRKNHKRFNTRFFRLHLSYLWESLKVGLPGGSSITLGYIIWAFSIHLVATNGENDLLSISFGSTIWALNRLFTESISKALTTLYSYFLGRQRWDLVWKSMRSGVFLFGVVFLVIGLCYLCFSEQVIRLIVQQPISFQMFHHLRLSLYWLWGFFLIEGITFCLLVLVIALKKTAYLMIASVAISLVGIYLPFTLAYHFFHPSPDTLWLLMWINMFITMPIYWYRIQKSYQSPLQKIVLDKKI